MSYMFEVAEEEWKDVDKEMPTRIIKKVSKVIEVSAVNYPAYEDTTIYALIFNPIVSGCKNSVLFALFLLLLASGILFVS